MPSNIIPTKIRELPEFKYLKPEELSLVSQIVTELNSSGYSQLYEKLKLEDYREIPVDIETFLHDPMYLGKGLVDPEGRFTVFPYWVETLKKLFPDNITTAYRTLVLSGAIGLGKAQPLSSVVMTGNGPKRMGELSLNDMIYGSDGKLHRLLGIFPQGVKHVYKVTFTDGSSCECSDEHLWTIYPKNIQKYAKTVELKELIGKKLYRLNRGRYKERLYYIPMTTPLEYAHVDTFISPYIMGCLLGDGGLTNSSISFTNADPEIVDRFRKELNPGYILKKSGVRYSYRLNRSSRKWFRDVDGKVKQAPNEYAFKINAYGLGVKSVDKFIPDDYLFNDVTSRIELLQGLMDTDGTITKKGCTIQFNTVSPRLRDDFVTLVESLGGSAWYSSTKASYKKDGVRISCRESYTISLKLPKSIDPFYLPRKRARLNPRSIGPSRAIDDIRYLRDEECQCIYIDSKDHLYLTDHFIVTHNTLMAVLCILYQLYRMLCLKDPYLHYGLQPIDKITFSVMNITMEAAKGVAWDKLQQLVQSSPWFMAHGKISGRDTLEWQPNLGIELIYGSQPRHVIGRAVFSSFEDEISFQLNQDVDKQKEKAKLLISSIDARMQSRFMKGDYLPTLHILASSKRTDQSFLESYIENKKKNESKTTLIIDEPQWVIRTDKDSPNKFYVAVGNKFLDSEVLPLDITEQDLKIYTDRGYTLLRVPMGYREQFVDDIDIALTDIAGISTSNTTRYLSGPRILEVKDRTLKNPFTKEVITVGDSLDDTTQYCDYFDLDVVDKKMVSRPLYIHLDMSISGDKTGIAGVWIKGKKPTKEGQASSKELYYQLAFSVAIKAPKGHQISFEKNREFIRWLRKKGFNIAGVSSDTFQSAQIQQQLKAEHFNCSIISVDRVDAESRVCLPYQYLKSVIYEHRMVMYDAQLLTEELIGLERSNSGRIDHGPSGINCFTGDTKISLTDGREICIRDLIEELRNGKTNYVYSFNETLQKIEPKRVVDGWCSGRTSKLAIVTLDNGEVIRCTPEHRFMLRDGTYCEAQNLVSNDSLMPLYRKYPEGKMHRYRLYYDPIEDKWHFEHRQFAVNAHDEKISYIHRYHNSKNTDIINHKVVSVYIVSEESDVFDITVEDNHNFALTAGVFVHNSKDISDAVCGATFNASRDAERYAFDYGEDIDTVMDTNNSITGDSVKKQLSVDFNDEIRKMLDPVAKRQEELKQISNKSNNQNTDSLMYLRNGIAVF